jgi:hypothetical protein
MIKMDLYYDGLQYLLWAESRRCEDPAERSRIDSSDAAEVSEV